MDDLLGLDSIAPASSNPPSRTATPNYYPTLQPTPPFSGRSTPSQQPSNGFPKPPLPKGSNASPASDSFANLVSFGGAKTSKSLSLQDQQKAAEEARLKQAEERSKAFDRHFGQPNGQEWTSLESGRSTPSAVLPPPGLGITQKEDKARQSYSEIKKAPAVQRQPQQGSSQKYSQQGSALEDFLRIAPHPSHSGSPAPRLEPKVSPQVHIIEGDDDDIFGLGTRSEAQQSKPTAQVPVASAGENDDFLGDLARPVSEFPAKVEIEKATIEERMEEEIPEDRPLAELVDMGFPIAKAKEALSLTESSTNVQAAVGWLLNQAHEESKRKRPKEERGGSSREESIQTNEVRKPRSYSTKPAWMQDQGSSKKLDSRKISHSPINGETDATKVAAEIGSNLFRTANSLWKSGTTKLNKAVAEFNNEGDAAQPKWLKNASSEVPNIAVRPDEPSLPSEKLQTSRKRETTIAEASVTDEALMLESGDSRPAPRGTSRQIAKPSTSVKPSQRTETSMSREAFPEPEMARPQFLQQIQSNDPRSRTHRRNIEDQSAQAYVSPSRRRKPTPKPHTPEPDLFRDSSANHSQPGRSATAPKSSHEPNSQPPPQHALPARSSLSKSSIPQRFIPPLSPSALSSYTKSRQAGNDAVRRGDYADAFTHYSSSLSPLPTQHPLRIVILTNRALTNSKVGEPKAAAADAEAALQLIGDSKGIGEKIDSGEDGTKEMYMFWGKAMTRKAEALEQLEKWSEAGMIWKTCVEAGVGGGTSIAGRTRCEKAAVPTSTPVPRPAVKRPPQRPTPTASSRSTTMAAIDTAAVSRLRAANSEAERIDDEKFRLADTVSDRVSNWRKGKEGNLRALLASLENVLWVDAGWRRVGMGELILANKVKIVYMKGIAKVHPDKVCRLLHVYA